MTTSGELGYHTFAGVDTLIYVSQRQRFDAAGDYAITWDGQDKNNQPVPPGTYQYWIAAIDDEAPINMVGYSHPAHGNEPAMLMNSAGDAYIASMRALLTEGGTSDNLVLTKIGTDWIGTPTAWEVLDLAGVFDEVGGPMDIIPEETLGNGSFGKYEGNFFSVISGQGAVKWHISGDQVELITDFGSTGNGFAPAVNAGQQITSVDYFDGKLYLPIFGRSIDPKMAAVEVMDAQTGDPIGEFSLDDFYTIEVVDETTGDVSISIRSPYDLDVDETGISCSAYFSSLTVKLDLDGNIKWVNGNGDGFVDKIDRETGEFVDSASPFVIHQEGGYSPDGKGFLYVPLLGTSSGVSVDILGPDGSGVIHFTQKDVPSHWPQWAAVVEEEGQYDGLYYDIGSRRGGGGDPWSLLDFTGFGGRQVLHVPYDLKKGGVVSSVATYVQEVASTGLPEEYALEDAYPNPFNPQTTIEFMLPSGYGAELETWVGIYNLNGQLVRTLVSESLSPGVFQTVWDGTDASGQQVASGIYLYAIRVENLFTDTKKVTFLK